MPGKISTKTKAQKKTKAVAGKAAIASKPAKPASVLSGKQVVSAKQGTTKAANGKAQPRKSAKALKPTELKAHKARVKETEFGEPSEAFKKVSTAVANQELDLLCQRYPEADCELDFETPFQLITAVIMSAQTTDVNVNKVTKNLFRKYPDAKALANAPLDDIKEIIRSTGYYNAKATNIQNCAAKLVERFAGQVPNNLEDLVSLPGVGRKTANVVLGVAFGIPGWSVDTHVQRLSKRLGLTNEQDPEKIEYDLQKIFPGRDWSKLSITLIWHGRRTCFARKPNCEECPINHLCPSSLMPA